MRNEKGMRIQVESTDNVIIVADNNLIIVDFLFPTAKSFDGWLLDSDRSFNATPKRKKSVYYLLVHGK